MKKFILSTAAAVMAMSCTSDIDMNEIKVSNYKDGKECAVSLTFDDGMKEHYTIVAPELEKRGWRGTFWLCCAWIHDDPQVDTTHITWQEAVEMAEKGHEMSNHSWSHPDLTQLPAEEALKEIKLNDEAIEKHIGIKPLTFCFPYNSYNDETVAMAMEGRIGARLKEFWLGGQHSPMDYLHKQIEDAVASGSWIAGMTHGINYGYDCYENPAEFTEFLDYLKSQEDKVWVGTFREVAAYVKAAENTVLDVRTEGRKILITPSISLDQELYAGLLTMEVESKGAKIHALQDKKDLAVTYKDGKAYFSFAPFGGTVTVSQQRL